MMGGNCGQTNTFNSIGQLEWILEASYYYTYSQKEMVCELDKRNLRVRSDSNSSL